MVKRGKREEEKIRKQKPRFKETKVSPRPVTPEQKQNIAAQKAERARPEGTTVETKRMGTREEVVALEDRPGKEPQELPEELKVFKTEEGDLTTEKESIFQKEEEAPPSVAESVLKSVGLGVAIGVTTYAAGYGVIRAGAAGLRLLTSRGLTSKAVAETAAGKLTKQIISERIKLGGGRVLTNTYTTKLGLSLLQRLSRYGKYALGTFGVLSGIAFAGQFLATQSYNDSADAIDGYKFRITAAQREEDWAEVDILTEQFDEMYAVWEETEGLEIFNYPKAASSKMKQSKDVVDSVRRQRAKAGKPESIDPNVR